MRSRSGQAQEGTLHERGTLRTLMGTRKPKLVLEPESPPHAQLVVRAGENNHQKVLEELHKPNERLHFPDPVMYQQSP